MSCLSGDDYEPRAAFSEQLQEIAVIAVEHADVALSWPTNSASRLKFRGKQSDLNAVDRSTEIYFASAKVECIKFHLKSLQFNL
jgi:hypothetical protein